MSVTIAPPVKFALRLPEDGMLDPDEISLRRLRQAVAGKDASIPRPAAMALLLKSDFVNKDDDFAAVLSNEQEPSRIRYLAAVMLAKVATPLAREILVRNLRVGDQRVRAAVLSGLGRIGDGASLNAISRLGDDSAEARFAATLIACRYGQKGHDPPLPDENSFLRVSANVARPMQWQRAAPSQVELCIRSLAGDPFGIAFAEEPSYEIRCGEHVFMLLF